MTRAGLGQADDLLVVEGARRAASHHQAALLQLDGAPPESPQFALTHAQGDHQHIRRFQGVPIRSVDEPSDLVAGEGFDQG